jgi:hypothetical protein
MGNTIEKVSSGISAGYQHLFEMDDRYNMDTREIEAILYEICEKDRTVQLGRKWTHIDTRYLDQAEQDLITTGKGLALLSKTGLILDSVSVALAICGVFAGGLAPGFSAAGQAFNTSSQYYGKTTEARVGALDHRYSRSGSLIGEHSQQIQGAEREYEQAISLYERIMQSAQRTFELVASGNS